MIVELIKFYDTSAILNENYPGKNDYISSTVLRELENIKTAGDRKSGEVKHAARKAVRYLIDNPPNIYYLTEKDWSRAKRKYSFSDTGDNRILAELLILQKSYKNLMFWTSDLCFYLLAKQFGLSAHYCSSNETKGGLYEGYREYNLDDDIINNIYSSPNINILGLLINEYGIIYNNQHEFIDIIKWDGVKLLPLKYNTIKNKFIPEVKPKDIYQRIGFDLLQNRNIPVKLIQGRPGSGKDYVMISTALDLVLRRDKEKIIFIRNLIDLKDAPQIGYLQGSLEDKIAWGAEPIKDIVGGEEGYNWLQEQGIIQQENLGFLRGRNLGPNYIIYVTEGQNLTESVMQSIISRAAEGTEVWINADLKQIDKKIFYENNGIISLQQNLKGNPLFGAAYFPNSHRSAVAELSSLLTSY